MSFDHPAYKYAIAVETGCTEAPSYVKKQCAEIASIFQNKSIRYEINREKLAMIDGLTELMIMPPDSLRAGETVRTAAVGYQWLLWVSALCVTHRAEPNLRRYQVVILEIARKNAKTFDVAVFFILLQLLEPQFSKLYSVAPDGKLSREIKDSMKKLIKSSPALMDKFRIMRDSVVCKLNDTEFWPLNYSNDRLDGKLPTAFLVDEVGALPNNYALEAMRSGQLTIKNKLGCIISTKYSKFDNPFEDEVSYAKRVLDGLEPDDTLFALLYEPDKPAAWMSDDRVLAHANPLALEVPEIWNDLLRKRTRAITQEAVRENFLTKHCNIIYQGVGTESYVSLDNVRRGLTEKIDWSGREVWLGLDLAMTNDNCSVGMISRDYDDGILAESLAFVPEGKIDAKNRAEKLDYRAFVREGKCFACGDEIVDYGFIEKTVMGIEEKYGVTVLGVGLDRYNALSTAQKLEEAGLLCTIVDQHSRTLHPATKRLAEVIEQGMFRYEKNTLLEINFQNAKCTYDTNLNRYVSKKRSSGKVDMVVALINAMFMLDQYELSGGGWAAQT